MEVFECLLCSENLALLGPPSKASGCLVLLLHQSVCTRRAEGKPALAGSGAGATVRLLGNHPFPESILIVSIQHSLAAHEARLKIYSGCRRV